MLMRNWLMENATLLVYMDGRREDDRIRAEGKR